MVGIYRELTAPQIVSEMSASEDYGQRLLVCGRISKLRPLQFPWKITNGLVTAIRLYLTLHTTDMGVTRIGGYDEGSLYIGFY